MLAVIIACKFVKYTSWPELPTYIFLLKIYFYPCKSIKIIVWHHYVHVYPHALQLSTHQMSCCIFFCMQFSQRGSNWTDKWLENRWVHILAWMYTQLWRGPAFEGAGLLKPHMALGEKKDQNLIECAQTGTHLMCHYNQA